MTTKRFSESVESSEPKTSTSFIQADGYAFAGAAGLNVLQGGEWPYYIAAKRGTTDLVTYCEGDITEYVFADSEERDAAAKAWEQSDAEYAAELAAEEGHTDDDMGAAIVKFIADYALGDVDESTVATALECYAGEFESNGDYAESVADSWGIPYFSELRDAEGRKLPEWIQHCITVDWDDVALSLANTEGMTYFEHAHHYFHAAP